MFKDILTRYDLPPDTDYVPPKRILQYCVEEYISRGVKEDHTDLKKFLDHVIPFEGKRHFIYVQDEEGTTYNFHLDRYDCIKALLALSEHRLTVYFHPTAFKKWTKDKFAVSYRCIYVDIDDVSFPFTLQDANKEKIIVFLKEKYRLTDDLLPNTVTMSGHGLHLCYFIYETSDFAFRQKYVDSLITFFEGDKMTRNYSRKFRLPTSYNMKDPAHPVRSRLFFINESDDKNIHRLDPMLKNEEEIQDYFRKYNEKLCEKKNATRARNKAKKTAQKQEKKPPVDEKSVAPVQPTKKQDTTAQDMSDEPEATFDCSTLVKKFAYSKKSSFWNLIYDLHNFILRHNGDCLEGKRNQFIHILSNYAQFVMTEDETIEFCEQYFPENDEFHTEMIATVKATYGRHSVYWYNYCTIADILGFDEKDIAESRCNFSTERKAEAEKERNRRKYQKRTASVKTDAQIKREYCCNYIRDNIDKPVKQLVAELGLSQSTVYRIRSEIKAKK